MSDLTPVEATAMAVWSTGSADSTQCLMAVRAAIRAERARVAEEIAHELDARAEKTRREAFTPSVGIALAALFEEAASIARQHATT